MITLVASKELAFGDHVNDFECSLVACANNRLIELALEKLDVVAHRFASIELLDDLGGFALMPVTFEETSSRENVTRCDRVHAVRMSKRKRMQEGITVDLLERFDFERL